MELRHLKYFIAVSEELSFSKAAKRLNISQPPLSKQIKDLENEIGVQLFIRTKRKVELTDSGTYFLKYAYSILENIKHAKEKANKIHQGLYGELRISFTASVTYDLLPNIIYDFNAFYPDVDISVKQLETPKQIEYLHNGKVDVGLVVLPVNSSALGVEVIRKEKFVAALPKNHLLAKKKNSLTAIELSKYPLIITPRKTGPGYFDNVIGYFQRNNVYPKITQEAKELHTIIAFVASELGIALLPNSMTYLKLPNVVYKDIKEHSEMTIATVYRKDTALTLVKSFIKILKNNFD